VESLKSRNCHRCEGFRTRKEEILPKESNESVEIGTLFPPLTTIFGMNPTHNNPFRILGVPLTASARDITKQVNTLATYAEMGKAKVFDTDFSFFPPVNRTPEVIEEASKRIEQGENKLLHSLFWFWNNNSVDELALDVLKEGRIERAIEIWEKAIFATREKSYKPVALRNGYDNLINESSDWFEGDDDDHSLKRNDGAYLIERKAATSYSIPSVYLYLSNDEKDWSIECQTEWLRGVDDLGYGIVFGKDKGSYFSFAIAAAGYYRFDKYVDWNCTELIPWKSSAVVDTRGINHLQITNFSNRLSLYVNGQFVDSVQKELFFGNHLGFKVANAQTIVFSDLRICKLVEDDSYGAGIEVSSKNFSNIKNLSLLFLSLSANGGTLRHEYLHKGAALANKCFSSEDIEEYAKLVAGERYVHSPDKVLQFYISNVVDSLKPYLDKPSGISTGELFEMFSDYPIVATQYLSSKFLTKPIQNIEKEIASAQAARSSYPSSAVDVGESLVEITKPNIEFLKAAVGKRNYQYQNIADRLANAVIQCAIDSFNSTKDDEPGLPLYEYGSLIAVSRRTKERATENLGSCKEWIKNKIYFFCWFCGKNQPDLKSAVSKTVYKVNRRSYFPRSVQFSYGDISIPRCQACLDVHNKSSAKYWTLWIGCLLGCLLIGVFLGTIVDNMPSVTLPGGYTATGAGDGSGTTVGIIIGAAVGALIGWIAAEREKRSRLSKAGVKDTSNSFVSQYPVISQRLKDGWQLSKPTA